MRNWRSRTQASELRDIERHARRITVMRSAFTQLMVGMERVRGIEPPLRAWELHAAERHAHRGMQVARER